MERYDVLVVGGGIFGCYAALYLAGQGRKVCLIEREQELFRKASLVNQARLHGGYHYPRSFATAAMSDEHKERFTSEHRAFIHTTFDKYYAIDRYGSFTDPMQFERFCERLHIRCERVKDQSLFNFNRLEAVYLTEEYTFDPVLLSAWYIGRVEASPDIELLRATEVAGAEASGTAWQVTLQSTLDIGQQREIEADMVINATYCATNAVNRIFGVGELQLTHEISEIGFIRSEQFANKGLTVMDGPFGSIMPYGKSGLLSLSSVAYTHHKISYDNLPHFDCQLAEDRSCTPEGPGICTTCERRPASNARKMLSQMQQYFAPQVTFEYWFSYFTIKSKLKASYIDDGRPTEISRLRETPLFFCLFAGKINSVYEVEKVVGRS